MENSIKRYGFGSLLPLIIGSVIGIGSYFKIGKILKATGGSATIAIWTWLIAIALVVSSLLVLSEMISSKDNEEIDGGMVHIIEKYTNLSVAKLFNQFIIFFYSPIIIIIEAAVASQFLFVEFLGIKSDIFLIISSIVIIIIFMVSNFLSVGFGKIFQSSSLTIKLIPLTLLIVFGLLIKPFTDPTHFYLGTSFTQKSNVSFWTGVVAAAPGALFALDGWQWITSLSSETKGGVKTLVKSMIVGMFIISIIYVLYTLGGLGVISGKTWATGGTGGEPLSIAEAFTKLFSANIGRFISLFIVFAALGGLNAYTIYYNRQVRAAAERKWLPNSEKIEKLDEKTLLPKTAGIYGLVYTIILWMILIAWLFVQPELFGTTSAKIDVLASINLASDVWTVGIFGFAFILLAFIALKVRKSDEQFEFRLPTLLFYLFTFLMTVGGIFAIYVNVLESPIVYSVGLVLLLIVFISTPKGENIKHNNSEESKEETKYTK